MGPSPIVTSKVISPKGHDCSPKKPTRGVFESTQRDLIDDFSFKNLMAISYAWKWQYLVLSLDQLALGNRGGCSKMRLRELLLLAKMRSEFCLEIFIIEDTTCFLTVLPYSDRVFEGSYLGLLSHYKNRYGKAFSVRLGEGNPLSNAQKVLPNPQGSRQHLSGLGWYTQARLGMCT
ncbi:hypothetical protein Tco_0204420 [Tanacetum coccineum]